VTATGRATRRRLRRTGAQRSGKLACAFSALRGGDCQGACGDPRKAATPNGRGGDGSCGRRARFFQCDAYVADGLPARAYLFTQAALNYADLGVDWSEVEIGLEDCGQRIENVGPPKSARPVSISYSTTPNAQMSARRSTLWPRACSGLTYAAVPMIAPAMVARMVSVGDCRHHCFHAHS